MGHEAMPAENYRVEVSGWDALDNFFVERTNLEWVNDQTKRVALRSALSEGSVVFMRLLQSFGDGTGLPIACNAVKVTAKDASGWIWVELARLHPRSAGDGTNAAEALALRLS